MLSASQKKYRIINNECMLEMAPTELRRKVAELSDEIAALKQHLRLREDTHITDIYNISERMRLVQKDLESLVVNDKLLLAEFRKLSSRLSVQDGVGYRGDDTQHPIHALVLSHQISHGSSKV